MAGVMKVSGSGKRVDTWRLAEMVWDRDEDCQERTNKGLGQKDNPMSATLKPSLTWGTRWVLFFG
jgi:hypothetical protein